MALLNTAYAKNEGKPFGPLFFPFETYSFYINSDAPTSDPDFDNFRLDLRDVEDNLIHADLGPLQRDFVNQDFYRIYCTFSFPEIPFGWYKLAIYDHVKDVTKCTSNMIQVEESSLASNIARIFYRNESNLYNINYEGLPGFYNIFTLPLIQTEFQIETERKQYRNVTDRKLRNLKNYRDDTYKIESYYFDETAHRAIAAAYDHDTIFIDETFVVPKDNYQVESNPQSVLSKGSITVIADVTVVHPLPDMVKTPKPGVHLEFSDEYSDEYI